MGFSIPRLPVQLCNLAAYFYMIAIIFKNQKLFNFCYIINILGALIAILAPDLNPGPLGFWNMHYTFEHIHPFCDGNGRMGRLLMNNFLISKGFEKVKAVSFSRSIEKERSDYDIAFALSDNVYSDCTYFIEYMLIKMLDAFEDCISD